MKGTPPLEASDEPEPVKPEAPDSEPASERSAELFTDEGFKLKGPDALSAVLLEIIAAARTNRSPFSETIVEVRKLFPVLVLAGWRVLK